MSSPRPGRRDRARPDAGNRTAARAAARRSAGKAPATTSSRSALTTRAAVLGLVLCALVLSAAVPVREYLAQHGEIARTRTAQAAQAKRIAALETRKQQLQDPAYVQQQARERFGYVLPGETLYTVLRPATPSTPVARAGQTAPAGPDTPWYSRVWGSMQAADAAPGK
ncbi:MAG: hypothetical protein JWN17_2188 [Frankiales bacterium]|nr:hypothetical protein [Frankiales bacterium]